ncbi:single-stranded nucleic acid binding protein R3H domain-containing protein [Trypanosoma rangeli]|uniref:Single-stranded nucleic acid binding protein R3H domain-containing protein n=1 Tax=Trypanosoma rangeli TaxID=5698 RepID=A0A422P3G0_TRYRA|nr:single-stranded nucleic acid binding protein R3H domain-containing protein [Trypanosoma rangeli]RNF12248.1 single-stranded nucleic acid binding protein R3H domain-containing protein [Trypanosoma rangeli]|eukprot:RNF12248.1 single-stranded nucleic acid binding protein R3H domain-containing protein [Trypanosoma rangeli]
MRHSKRSIRCRVVPFKTLTLRHVEEGNPEAPSRREPPMSMPLAYIQECITDIQQYRTEDALWSKETLREAWKTLHQSLQTATEREDVVQKQHVIDNDLVGLALCTSYAELKHLLSILSPSIRDAVTSHPSFCHAEVEEFFLHLGQEMEVRGAGWVAQLPPPSVGELQFSIEKIGRFGEDGRGCIRNTPHRVSLWRGRRGEPLGVTIRVGRYVPNVAQALIPLAHKGSVLILSKAGMGKTTLLRDLAASLSREPSKPRVVVVDTSNEIGGDCPIPLPFLGRCRRVQVPRREDQEQIMTQILQNHAPEYVIVDEIATASEAEAAWSMTQRGVHLIATCHGESLEGLLQNQSLNLLVGGAAQAFLSNEERRLRNKSKKTILERPHLSPFRFVVELNARNKAHVYTDVNAAVDLLLDDQDAKHNASVGQTVMLNRQPSGDLLRAVEDMNKVAQLSTNCHLGGCRMLESERDDGSDLCHVKVSSNGQRSQKQWVGERIKKYSRGRKRTDEEFLEDLQDFL